MLIIFLINAIAMLPEIILEPGALQCLCASAMETYHRESGGFLMGKMVTRTVRKRPKKMLLITAVYPQQTARRGYASISDGNMKAGWRARVLLYTLSGLKGVELVGGYHTHPHDACELSKSDLNYLYEEVRYHKGREGFAVMDKWLEIVVSIEKRRYITKYSEEPFHSWHLHKRKLEGIVAADSGTGYHFTVGAFWVSKLDKEPKSEFFGLGKKKLIKEVKVHAPV
ncbi:MAG: Mov34/MPN/PAD-1 family protein [Thermoplasmata archaeon]|nr:Mov34/MPN/PAD-1 family protein [Thermoplasmata archaeon]